MKGQARKDFRIWYNNKEPYTPIHTPYDVFMGKSLSEQYGVLVDWFDSVGIKISTGVNMWNTSEYTSDVFCLDYGGVDLKEINEKTRTQARQKAIEKANEIYNNRV